jgi:hypothetical protein
MRVKRQITRIRHREVLREVGYAELSGTSYSS